MKIIILTIIKYFILISILVYFIYIICSKIKKIKSGKLECYGCNKDCYNCKKNKK